MYNCKKLQKKSSSIHAVIKKTYNMFDRVTSTVDTLQYIEQRRLGILCFLIATENEKVLIRSLNFCFSTIFYRQQYRGSQKKSIYRKSTVQPLFLNSPFINAVYLLSRIWVHQSE